MPQNSDQHAQKVLEEIMKDFDLVPKDHDLRKSEYRYRSLMVQMLEKLLAEQRSKLKALEMGLIRDRGMDGEEQQSKSLKGFPHKGPRIDKAIYFIKREGRPLQLREIAACMSEIEPIEDWEMDAYKQSLSVDLSQGLSRGRIKRYDLPRKRGGWYFPNSWADDNGELLAEYKKLID